MFAQDASLRSGCHQHSQMASNYFLKETQGLPRYRFSVLIFVLLLVSATVLWIWPLTTQPNISFGFPPPSCFGISVSYVGSGFSYTLERPLFGATQYILPPGSSASLEVTYDAPHGNLTQVLNPPGIGLSHDAIGVVGKVNSVNGSFTETRTSDVGLNFVLSSMSFSGIVRAVLTYVISATRASVLATFFVPLPQFCFSPLFLTVGYFPYLGPLPFRILQPILFILYLTVAALVTAVIHLIMRRHSREF